MKVKTSELTGGTEMKWYEKLVYVIATTVVLLDLFMWRVV